MDENEKLFEDTKGKTVRVNNVFFSDSASGCFQMTKMCRESHESAFNLDDHLDLGWIKDEAFSEEREQIWDILSPGLRIDNDGSFEEERNYLKKKMKTVLSRASEGDITRIWYSEQAGDLCGLYWLVSKLEALSFHGPVRLIKLPYMELRQDLFTESVSWGMLDPKDFEMCLPLEEEADEKFCEVLVNKWEQLRCENSMLRASLEGVVYSVPDDFWDWAIRDQIAVQPEEFNQAKLIGDVIQRGPAAIPLEWIMYRVNAMIEKGLIEVLAPPDPERVYYRLLRKTALFHSMREERGR